MFDRSSRSEIREGLLHNMLLKCAVTAELEPPALGVVLKTAAVLFGHAVHQFAYYLHVVNDSLYSDKFHTSPMCTFSV